MRYHHFTIIFKLQLQSVLPWKHYEF